MSRRSAASAVKGLTERDVIESRWGRMSGIDLRRGSTLGDKTGWQMTPFRCNVLSPKLSN